MRVYVPVTAAALRGLSHEGMLDAPLECLAVTEKLRVQLGALGDEELEFAVSTAAAVASWDRLREAGVRRGRRIVVVAEVDDPQVVSDADSAGLVTLRDGLSRDQVDAVLADPAEIDTAVEPDDELAWFATQEIPDLLA